jgi:hypothetical protein
MVDFAGLFDLERSDPDITFQRNINKFNGKMYSTPSNFAPKSDGPLSAKRAGPAPSCQGWRVPRHRFAACGLDRLSLARQGLGKRLRLIGSGALPSRHGEPAEGLVRSDG